MFPHLCSAGGELSSASRAFGASSAPGLSWRCFVSCWTQSRSSYIATGIGIGSSFERTQHRPEKCSTIGFVFFVKYIVTRPSGLSVTLVPCW